MIMHVLCEKLIRRSALAVLCLALPLAAQNYQGNSTYLSPGPASTSALVMNLTINGSAITGAIGVGSTVATIPVSGMRNGSNCTVGVAGGITYTGNCTATSFSGTYRVGAQSGTFSVAGNGAGWMAAAVPASAPVVAATAVAPAARAAVAAPTAAAQANNGVVSWLAAPPGAAPAVAAPVPTRAAPLPIVATPALIVAPRVAPAGVAVAPPAIAANGVVGWLAAPPQAQPPPPVEVPWLAATNGPAQGATPNGTGTQVATPPVPTPPPQWNPVPLPPNPPPPPAPPVLPVILPTPPVLPPVPPVQVTCPASGAPQLYQGVIYAGGSKEAVTFSLTFNGGTVSGSMGIAEEGTLAGTPNPLTGTMSGQHCRLTPGGLNQGAVFDGTCDGHTFLGTESQQGTSNAFTTSLVGAAANAATAECPVAPPAPVPPPPPTPVVCPEPTATGTYQGAVHLPDGLQGRLSLHLVSNGGAITGLLGKGDLGTNPTPVDPLAGTMTGQRCRVTVGGANTGVVLDGTCDGQTFAGTYVGNGLNTVFAVKNMTGATPAGCNAPPGPTPLPNPVPTPMPVPPVAPVIRYCGMFGNITANFSGSIEFDLATPGTWTNANLIIGQPLTPTVPGDFGSGKMSGTWAPTCQGSSGAGFTITWAQCSAQKISGNYTIMGGNGQQQNGTFSAAATTAAACPQPPVPQ